MMIVSTDISSCTCLHYYLPRVLHTKQKEVSTIWKFLKRTPHSFGSHLCLKSLQ